MKIEESHENIVVLSDIREKKLRASSPYGPVRAGLTTLPDQETLRECVPRSTTQLSHRLVLTMTEQEVRNQISEEILKWHTPENNRSQCCYGDCTHVEDAAIARGEKFE